MRICTYLIRFGSQQFVLRRPPVRPVAPTAHDMPREFRLLQAIHPHFPLAPGPILLCEDISVIGVPFYLMERRTGLIVRNRIPPRIGDDEGLRRRISQAVVDTLVALHGIDIYATGVVRIGKPTGFVDRQVRGWSERWQRSMTTEVSEMDEVARWLTDYVPTETPSPQSFTMISNSTTSCLMKMIQGGWWQSWIGKCVRLEILSLILDSCFVTGPCREVTRIKVCVP